MIDYKEKINKLIDLNKAYVELNDSIIKEITEKAIYEANKSSKIKKINNSCFIVKFSDIIGKPLSPLYYDLGKGMKIFIDYLSKYYNISDWGNEIKNLIDANGNIKIGKNMTYPNYTSPIILPYKLADILLKLLN